MNELALFAGNGGGILGGKLLGWRTICAVEINAYCARRLLQRQNEGHLPFFPVWDDVCSFDGSSWRGKIDVVSGGFPCTDLSPAGNQDGLDGKESGLWREMFRIVGEVLPRFVLVENSSALTYLGGVRVIADFTKLGYNCRWGVMGADAAGASHLRRRLWIIAYRNDQWAGWREWFAGICPKTLSFAYTDRLRELQQERSERHERGWSFHRPWIYPEPELLRVDDGLPHRVERTRAVGMAQVPAVVALAWRTLNGEPSR